jgi:predicted Zn-dependent peptidase
VGENVAAGVVAVAVAEAGEGADPDGTIPVTIRRTTLDSGLRVVTEAMPELRSVALGYWVATGSRDETAQISGASHFLEHLLFKGTARRTAHEIAHAIESVGGDMNAFTTQELTAFYVRVPDFELDLALDILADIIWSPALRDDEIESERQVILEEIKMHDDTPDDLVHDVFGEALFPDHPLGRPVAGTSETIGAMQRDAIAGYHADRYRPGTVVVAAAGRIEHDVVVEKVATAAGASAPGDGSSERSRTNGLAPPARLAVQARPIEQVHLVTGTRALPRGDDDRYALAVLNQALGGGMSSRLFQEVREKRGLAYSVYSFRAGFAETGAFGVYVGTSPERMHEALAVVDAELDRVVAERGISDDELDAAKGHLRGSMALSLESSQSRMHRIGSSELTLGEIQTLDEIVVEIDSVTPDDIGRVVDRVLADGERTLAAVGPIDEDALAAR